jgi:hypothetical protein
LRVSHIAQLRGPDAKQPSRLSQWREGDCSGVAAHNARARLRAGPAATAAAAGPRSRRALLQSPTTASVPQAEVAALEAAYREGPDTVRCDNLEADTPL